MSKRQSWILCGLASGCALVCAWSNLPLLMGLHLVIASAWGVVATATKS